MGYEDAVGMLSTGLIVITFGIALVLYVAMVAANWVLFQKAGEEGWKSLVPIYSAYILFRIVYGEGWKFVLCLIPYVGGVVSCICYFRMAQAYGKDAGFGIGMVFLPFIFMFILAFGDAQYQGPVGSFL